MYVLLFMTKIISIADDAYDALKTLKGKKDSFTDVIRRLSTKGKKRTIMDFAGMWKDNDEFDKIFSKIGKDRSKFKLREVQF